MIKKLLKIIYLKLPQNQKIKAIYYYKLFCWFHKNLAAELIRFFIKNKKVENINLFEQKFYSQNGEDGIIRIIFDKIKTTNKFCVEFGIHPHEGNTIHLQKNKWYCLWMDGNGDDEKIKKEFITAENINLLFKKYNVPKEFDLLSIDIDYNDYWIWKAINIRPRVVVIEYNSSISLNESKVVEYEPNKCWDGTNYFGASLLALYKLGINKGYTLIGCDNSGTNAFFVRHDLVKNNFKVRDIKEIYKPPKYGKKINGKYIGHPPSTKNDSYLIL